VGMPGSSKHGKSHVSPPARAMTCGLAFTTTAVRARPQALISETRSHTQMHRRSWLSLRDATIIAQSGYASQAT
jgi:hypothetical protein